MPSTRAENIGPLLGIEASSVGQRTQPVIQHGYSQREIAKWLGNA